MNHPETYAHPWSEIEATCNGCGQKLAEGSIPYRDVGNREPYCPNCDGTDLTYHRPSEDR